MRFRRLRFFTAWKGYNTPVADLAPSIEPSALRSARSAECARQPTMPFRLFHLGTFAVLPRSHSPVLGLSFAARLHDGGGIFSERERRNRTLGPRRAVVVAPQGNPVRADAGVRNRGCVVSLAGARLVAGSRGLETLGSVLDRIRRRAVECRDSS